MEQTYECISAWDKCTNALEHGTYIKHSDALEHGTYIKYTNTFKYDTHIKPQHIKAYTRQKH